MPDFSGNPELLQQVFDAAPEVFAHNVETVPRIFKRIRPAFRYERSLDVISQGRAAGLVTKSNLILGMGETREEVSDALRDLHDAGMRPAHHHPVPAARARGTTRSTAGSSRRSSWSFARGGRGRSASPACMAGPLVRSSYRAGRLWAQAMQRRGRRSRRNWRTWPSRAPPARRPPACWRSKRCPDPYPERHGTRGQGDGEGREGSRQG